jgi:hypothetical protein
MFSETLPPAPGRGFRGKGTLKVTTTRPAGYTNSETAPAGVRRRKQKVPNPDSYFSLTLPTGARRGSGFSVFDSNRLSAATGDAKVMGLSAL